MFSPWEEPFSEEKKRKIQTKQFCFIRAGEPFLDRFPDVWTAEDKDMSKVIMSLWCSFARTGYVWVFLGFHVFSNKVIFLCYTLSLVSFFLSFFFFFLFFFCCCCCWLHLSDWCRKFLKHTKQEGDKNVFTHNASQTELHEKWNELVAKSEFQRMLVMRPKVSLMLEDRVWSVELL